MPQNEPQNDFQASVNSENIQNDRIWMDMAFWNSISGLMVKRREFGRHALSCRCLELCREIRALYFRSVREREERTIRFQSLYRPLQAGIDFAQATNQIVLNDPYPDRLPISWVLDDPSSVETEEREETMPTETATPVVETQADDPVVIKRASEVNPVNPESILLSAKLSRSSKGLTLFLKSPILEAFFRLLAEDRTIAIPIPPRNEQNIVRWKIGHVVQYLSEGLTSGGGGLFPVGTSHYAFMVDNYVNLQILTTKGLGEGVVLHSDIPMTKEAMRKMLDSLKMAAKDIYMAFCIPVEGNIDLTVRERLASPGGSIVE